MSKSLLTLLTPSLSVIDNVYEVLREMEHIAKVAMDTLECRIERVLQAMSWTALLELPEDVPVPPQDLLSQAESTVGKAAQALCRSAV